MLKPFCDLCGEAASVFGRPQTKATSFDGITQIVVRAVVTFEGHPSGFGGPPDLCAQCQAALLASLASSVQSVGDDRGELGQALLAVVPR
jgi:hypothetical protein